jgi:coenzyme Q-binding protein COQ10
VATYQSTRRVAFEPEQLFSIVSDVARYGEFLPLCTAANVWDERTDVQGRRHFRGSLDIAYPKLGLKETFISNVTADPDRLTVRATSNEGPVKHIDNRWLFTPARGGCDIDFHLEYEMSSRLLQMAMGAAFEVAVRKIMTAFEERARLLSSHQNV